MHVMDKLAECKECSNDDSSLRRTLDGCHERVNDEVSVLGFLFE